MAKRLRVLPAVRGLGVFDYLGLDDVALAPGDLVTIPLGSRQVAGVVWDDDAAAVPAARLKPVAAKLDLPPLSAVTRRFVDWVAAYYLCPPGAVLKMVLNVPSALAPPPMAAQVTRGDIDTVKATPQRMRALAALGEDAMSPAALAAKAGVSPAVVRSMVAAGALTLEQVTRDREYPVPDPGHDGPVLDPDQAEAAAALIAGNAGTYLLEGVTGSGKTEVYFEAIAAALADAPAQILVLVPEIALTAQWLARFQARFGAPPVAWHSELTDAERRDAWRGVANGGVRVVVGARSALFLPFADLRLIVVDEEHDQSFKQEENPSYQARDMAVLRGHLGGIKVVLASATPSLESLVNAGEGRYRHLKLVERYGAAELPAIQAIDMRALKLGAGRWISPALAQAITDALARGEQALLFLNRRGYAPLTLCRMCGGRIECPSCSAWLVEHRSINRLVCHHCGYARGVPTRCPACDAEHSLVACGPGVERLAEEAAALFPDARLLTLSSDNLEGVKAAAKAVAMVEQGLVDIVIGTQLVAKGHHFPKLTLVGVVDADLGLAGGDLRAAERCFQQITQVAGRAGRAADKGTVLIQTHMPENPVMAALVAGDKVLFMARERAARQARGLPPFGRLAALIVSGPDQARVVATARLLGRSAPAVPGVEVLGPAPAPLAQLRGRHRQRLLIKAGREVGLQKLLRAWLVRVKPAAGVRVAVDIDPYSFL